MLRIACTTIAKNEVGNLSRFASATAGLADLYVLLDTGSTDGTPELAAKLGFVVYQYPWKNDGAAARNAAVEAAGDCAWVCVFDCDEVLHDAQALRLALEAAPDSADAVSVNYETGSGHKFCRPTILRPGRAEWKYRAHTQLIYQSCHHVDVLLEHPGPIGRRRGTDKAAYLEALRLDAEENPENPHRRYYYGRELSYANDPAAVSVLAEAAALSRWPEEAGMAMVYAGRVANARKAPALALWCFRQGAARCPGLRDPWCEVSRWTPDKTERRYAARRAMKIKEQRFFDCDPRLYNEAANEWLRRRAHRTTDLQPA